MTDRHDKLQEWMLEWQHQDDASPPAEALGRYVRRRSTMLMASVAAETIVGVVGFIFLAYLAIVRPDPVERIVMSTLSLACAATVVFGWWNWRGSLRAVGRTTTAYLELSISRLVRLRRALVIGWLLLAVEMTMFTPWVWYRMRTAPTPTIWPWVLLLTLGALAAIWLIALGRWLRREEVIVEGLRRECGDEARSRA